MGEKLDYDKDKISNQSTKNDLLILGSHLAICAGKKFRSLPYNIFSKKFHMD